MTQRADFLGLAFDARPAAEIEAWLAARTATSAFGYVVTPNVDHMVRLAEAPAEVRQAYADADLCLCDSRVLARLATWAGVTLPVVPGSDLVAALFARVATGGDRVCLIGGGPTDADALRALHPTFEIMQHRPPMGLRTDPAAMRAAVAFAVASRARFTLLAVGSPQQELLARALAAQPDARGTALCIGASVDFLVGTQTRAPRVVRTLGVEWVWRLATSPRRLARRYLIDGPAIFPIVWRWRRARRRRP